MWKKPTLQPIQVLLFAVIAVATDVCIYFAEWMYPPQTMEFVECATHELEGTIAFGAPITSEPSSFSLLFFLSLVAAHQLITVAWTKEATGLITRLGLGSTFLVGLLFSLVHLQFLWAVIERATTWGAFTLFATHISIIVRQAIILTVAAAASGVGFIGIVMRAWKV
jgi:hypothetical protein